MQLGNMVFGNATMDTNPIDREKFTTMFQAYLKYMGFNHYGHYEGETESGHWNAWAEDDKKLIDKFGKYENDVFSIFPYWWGDCECDYNKFDENWCDTNKHKPECYWEVTKKMESEKGDRLTLEDVKPLLEKHNLPEQGWGMHCTCDHDDRWHKA